MCAAPSGMILAFAKGPATQEVARHPLKVSRRCDANHKFLKTLQPPAKVVLHSKRGRFNLCLWHGFQINLLK
jgi:hypothetical protein